MEGWISVHRKIQDSWIWEEKPYSKGQAWIDLLLMANHEDNRVCFNNEVIEVERGSFITSEVKLSKKWGWSRTKVRDFLELLEKDSMIIKKTDSKKTGLSIVNFNDYQDLENRRGTGKKTGKKTGLRPSNSNIYEDSENREKNSKKDTNNKEYINNIVEYLNLKTGKNFSAKASSTETHINARLSDGYLVDDFKKVIDIKVSQWKGTDFEKYLRPSTLFGTKFEGYLNEKPKATGTENWRGSDTRL